MPTGRRMKMRDGFIERPVRYWAAACDAPCRRPP
ncbi:hypothetical protein BURMUCGD1_2242 [Burkholderia multivorans CGD1]|nr:hypothetical protein BURMUCGD1_2242 [Burkholderia multivorans CGD1]